VQGPRGPRQVSGRRAASAIHHREQGELEEGACLRFVRHAVIAVSKYFKILRISLMERLVYRADFFVATLFRFLPLLSTFLLWEAVYSGSGEERIAGFT